MADNASRALTIDDLESGIKCIRKFKGQSQKDVSFVRLEDVGGLAETKVGCSPRKVVQILSLLIVFCECTISTFWKKLYYIL
jgi:hypothetical protein